MLPVAIVFAAIWSVVIWLSSICCVNIALSAILADVTASSAIIKVVILLVAILAVVTELSAKSTVLTAPFTIFAEVTALSASSLLVTESAAILAVVTLLAAIFAVLTCAFANCKDVTALFAISLEPTEFSAIFAEVTAFAAMCIASILPVTNSALSTVLAAKLVDKATAAPPLKLIAEAVTSPVREKALVVARVVAVSALPVRSPVTSP